MLPVIFKIGPLSVYSYGLMLAIAVVVCSYFLSRDVKPLNISSDVVFDFVIWTVFGGIVGARIFYIILNLEYFINTPSEIFQIQNGGIAWQGGLITGVIIALVYIKKKKLPFPGFLDCVAPYIALGQVIGRIGCFLNGCCYGRPADWGVYFPVHQAQLHPTQLYLSGSFVIVFLLLKSYQKKSPEPGRVFLLYLMLASIVRFVIEYWRADHFSTLFGLSVFQYVCLTIFILAFYANSRIKSQPRS